MSDSIRVERNRHRSEFAEFLDRLAADGHDRDDWLRFVITHYPDEFLEEMRRCTVRLGIGEWEHDIESAEGRQILRAWAIAIRCAV